jgi:hypothetical protein
MLGLFAAHFWNIGQDNDLQSGIAQQQLPQLPAMHAAAGLHIQQQLSAPAALAAAAAAAMGPGHAPAEASAAAAAALTGLAVQAVAQTQQHSMAPQMLSLEAPLLAYSC